MEFTTVEEVVNLTIPNGQSSARVDITPPEGQIVRVVIFHNGLTNNTGIVNASIEDDNRQELSKLQHIDNYRSRSSSFFDCKPFYNKGGRKLWFKVQATANFTATFNAQLIFIYADGVEIRRNISIPLSHDNC